MTPRLPKLALIWIYDGDDPRARRTTIDSIDYPDFTVIPTDGTRTLAQLAVSVPEDSEACVFWADDGKPVGSNFLREMVGPLSDLRTDMHLWSGNALAMPIATFHAVENGQFIFRVGSFMKLALLYLDASFTSRGRRAHVSFSSTEQLAPMCQEPVGLPS